MEQLVRIDTILRLVRVCCSSASQAVQPRHLRQPVCVARADAVAVRRTRTILIHTMPAGSHITSSPDRQIDYTGAGECGRLAAAGMGKTA